MSEHRDIDAFDARAESYESGWLGRLHHTIVERTVEIALDAVPEPDRVLDVGCGTGYLLRLVAGRCLRATELAGVDPAANMIEAARRAAADARLRFTSGIGAEHLPFGDATFDLVFATTSFDHWSDQRAGLRECARVLTPSGHLVLVDQFSALLAPTVLVARRGKARTRRRVARMLRQAGFDDLSWHNVSRPIIKAVIGASRAE